MHIHILGIAGTFMGSIARLAIQLGFEVTGQDNNIYPPMSSELERQGIKYTLGYELADLPDADLIIIGNVMRRGMPIIEHILNNKIQYMSGPQFISRYILDKKQVLAVTGTHGKTTTTAMLTWILANNGIEPGYLIAGVTKDFKHSADIGKSDYFVIEADEYDCAFFDKRAKFIHYKPQILIINNIEYDHADIYPDIQSIFQQFHHLLRIIPGNGTIIHNAHDHNVETVINMGCWTNLQSFAIEHADWQLSKVDGLQLKLHGSYNLLNALAAIAAAKQVGIDIERSVAALSKFSGVKRRQELLGNFNGIQVYDDFAHHPTAIRETVQTFTNIISDTQRLVVIVEIGSNTMRNGANLSQLQQVLGNINPLFIYYDNELNWQPEDIRNAKVYSDTDIMLESVLETLSTGDVLLMMSNGALGGFKPKLLDKLQSKLQYQL